MNDAQLSELQAKCERIMDRVSAALFLGEGIRRPKTSTVGCRNSGPTTNLCWSTLRDGEGQYEVDTWRYADLELMTEWGCGSSPDLVEGTQTVSELSAILMGPDAPANDMVRDMRPFRVAITLHRTRAATLLPRGGGFAVSFYFTPAGYGGERSLHVVPNPKTGQLEWQWHS